MSNRAVEAAMKVYPVKVEWVGNQYGGPEDINKLSREKYQQGYEQAEKDLGWISVKDRLPEEDKWVFVCVDMQGVPQCVGLGYLIDGEWCDDENDDGFCVDYWMPIPKLPKEEEK